MAQIDMKKATIKILDGSTAAAGATMTALAASGATAFSVAASDASKFAKGAWFKFANDSRKYMVTSAASTGTISFVPAVAASKASGTVVTASNCNDIEVKIGEGNLTYSEKFNREYFRDRGRLDLVRDGDEEPIDVSLDSTWEFIQYHTNDPQWPVADPNTATLEDALKNINGAATWESTAPGCQPYAVDLLIIYAPDCGSTYNEYILLRDFRQESIDHDMKGGTLSLSGKCNATTADIFRIPA